MTHDSSVDVSTYDAVHAALIASSPARVSNANVFLEDRAMVTARFADGRVNDMAVARRAGSNVRWITEDRSWCRAVDSIDPDRVAAFIHADHAGSPPGHADASPQESLVPIVEMLDVLLAKIDHAARDHDPRVQQVLANAEWSEQFVVTVGLDGVGIERRHLRYLTLRVVAGEGGRIAAGFYTPASSDPAAPMDPVQIGQEAARRAVTALSGRPVPVKRLPVVVGSGRGMVLIHEACCHPLEGDEISRGSIYAGRLGERIAAEGVTIVDNPLVPGAPGSYTRDDEGTAAAPTRMVDDGVLRSYLTDFATSARLGLPTTGNGRREGFRDIPIPRMSNTCVEAGERDPAEIIADTESGLYAQHVGGGEVVEATGDFVFRVLNGFFIENGRLTDPIQETTVSGNGVEVLQGIDAVGNDVNLGAAKCGKFGQLVPVGVQGPTLRIGSLLVGGTK